MPQRAVATSGHEILYVSRDGYSDHLPKHVRNFAAGGCHSLLWPEATAFLNHLGTYSRPEANIVVYGPTPHCLFSHNSLLPPGQMVTTLLHGDKRRTLLRTMAVNEDMVFHYKREGLLKSLVL